MAGWRPIFRALFLNVTSRSFAIGTGRTENETEKTENQFSVCKTNFRFAHVRVNFYPPGQNLDADLSENRTGFGLQNLPIKVVRDRFWVEQNVPIFLSKPIVNGTSS